MIGGVRALGVDVVAPSALHWSRIEPGRSHSARRAAEPEPFASGPAVDLTAVPTFGSAALESLLTIHAEDAYEAAADGVASRTAGPVGSAARPILRLPSHDSMPTERPPESVQRHFRSRPVVGRPIGPGPRRLLESRLGHDLGAVRVHTGSQAQALADQLDANAFTLGSDVYLGAGVASPESPRGLSLLAHEATHVIQQAGRPANRIQRDRRADPRFQELAQQEAELNRAVAGLGRASGEDGRWSTDAIRRRALELAHSAQSWDQLAVLIRREWSSHQVEDRSDAKLLIDTATAAYAGEHGDGGGDTAWYYGFALEKEYDDRLAAAASEAVDRRAQQMEADPILRSRLEWNDRVQRLADEASVDFDFAAEFLKEFDRLGMQRFPGVIDPRGVPFIQLEVPLYGSAYLIKQYVLPFTGVGVLIGGYEAVTGEDLLTGERLPGWLRVLSMVSAILPFVGGAVRTGAKAVATGVGRGAKEIAGLGRELGVGARAMLGFAGKLARLPAAKVRALQDRLRAARGAANGVRLTTDELQLARQVDDALRELDMGGSAAARPPAAAAPAQPVGRPAAAAPTRAAAPDDILDDFIAKLDDTENPFEMNIGKRRARDLATGAKDFPDVPVSVDIDEPLAVGARNIKPSRAVRRALDPHDRQLLDLATNRFTKHLREGTADVGRHRTHLTPVSVHADPSSLLTRRFDEVVELHAVFDQAVSRVGNQGRYTATQLKAAVNRNIRDIIKTGSTPAGAAVRDALHKLGFEFVEGRGFVMVRR